MNSPIMFISVESKNVTLLFFLPKFLVSLGTLTKIMTDQVIIQNLKQKKFSAFSGSHWKKIYSEREKMSS